MGIEPKRGEESLPGFLCCCLWCCCRYQFNDQASCRCVQHQINLEYALILLWGFSCFWTHTRTNLVHFRNKIGILVASLRTWSWSWALGWFIVRQDYVWRNNVCLSIGSSYRWMWGGRILIPEVAILWHFLYKGFLFFCPVNLLFTINLKTSWGWEFLNCAWAPWSKICQQKLCQLFDWIIM